MIPQTTLTLPIRDVVPATPRTHIVRLALEGRSFAYQAGQAAFLQFEGSAKRRPYSIASAPEETARHGLLEFLVQTRGDHSATAAFELPKPGALATIEGPIGAFTFPEHTTERRFVFIAGGTGIAPLRSMLWHAVLRQRAGHMALVYSVRAPEDCAYLQQFEQLRSEGRIDLRYTATRAASDDWTGTRGRINASGLKDLIEPGQTVCFLCGPPTLIGEMRAQLNELGVRGDQIRMEQW